MDEEIGPQCNGPLQRKKTKANGWTKARRDAFLEELAMSCNVRRAHAAAEMGQGGAYRLRRRDPLFAKQWQEALELGYERLEMALVRRALEVVDELTIDEAKEPVEKMTVAQAITLLRQHRASVERGAAAGRRSQAREVATQEETDAVLYKRLVMVLRQRELRAEPLGVAAAATRPRQAQAQRGGAGCTGERMQLSSVALDATDAASRRIRIDDFWGWWETLTEIERRSILRGLNVAQKRELACRWYGFENDGQREPPGDWRIWLIQAGRGFGKTRAGAEWVSQVARDVPGARIALVAATMADGQRVMIEGPSGLIAVARDHEPVRWVRERRELRFASGAVATLYSSEAGEELRGPEHHAAWCDELAK